MSPSKHGAINGLFTPAPTPCAAISILGIKTVVGPEYAPLRAGRSKTQALLQPIKRREARSRKDTHREESQFNKESSFNRLGAADKQHRVGKLFVAAALSQRKTIRGNIKAVLFVFGVSLAA